MSYLKLTECHIKIQIGAKKPRSSRDLTWYLVLIVQRLKKKDSKSEEGFGARVSLSPAVLSLFSLMASLHNSWDLHSVQLRITELQSKFRKEMRGKG